MNRSPRCIFSSLCLLAVLSVGGAPLARRATADSEPAAVLSLTDSNPVAGAIRAPDDYQMASIPRSSEGAVLGVANDTVHAVAIVGDVGDSTATYRSDMERAVAALQTRGAAVTRFYYGDSAFSWPDVVTATEGAHLLLYMGHGVYWGGTCTEPTSVGGFYLGDGQFVTPDAIRADLLERLADDAVVIFSHACYSAGSTGCDPSGLPDVAEAQRRVTMYASPFVDLGFEAVYANNYFGSAEAYLNQLLETPSDGDSVGDIFRTTYPNLTVNHYDLAYPAAGYDLWLNGTEGAWNHAFVGQPTYTFSIAPRVPELGGLPASAGFLYSIPDAVVAPISLTVVPLNVSTSDPLTWTVTSSGDWFSVAPGEGTTPAGFTVVPDLLPQEVGSWSGAITVTVLAPDGVLATPQRIELGLVVTDQQLHYAYLPAVTRGSW